MDGATQIRALAEEILLDSAFRLEEPISQEGLSFVPIVRNVEKDTGDKYLNAAEAIESGVLKITEAGDAVDSIIAENTGSIPVLIEEAEVLVGQGSQDRIVITSVIVQPGETTRIPVKCVHAPHSLEMGAGFSTMGAASPELRSKMRHQKYCSIMTDVEHYIPEQAVDQTEIWSDVEQYGRSSGSSDPTKYAEALERRQKEVREATEQVKKSLPKRTCGLIVIDREGNVLCMEVYRNIRSFWKRKGVIESILLGKKEGESEPLAREAAWSRALQLLFRLKDVKQEEVIQQKDSENLHIGVDGLTGEAIVGLDLHDNLHSILYCSLSR